MPGSLFVDLPDTARCWVFAADRPLDGSAATRLLDVTDQFLGEWRAHGQPLLGARDWRDDHFLAIGVDEQAAGASGCSVDALFRALRGAEAALGTTFVSGGTVFWRSADGTVMSGSRADFAAACVRGEVTAHTPVFDTTITSVGQWRTQFERPMATSWHVRLKPVGSAV
jgi:hypothetical protein